MKGRLIPTIGMMFGSNGVGVTSSYGPPPSQPFMGQLQANPTLNLEYHNNYNPQFQYSVHTQPGAVNPYNNVNKLPKYFVLGAPSIQDNPPFYIEVKEKM